MAVFLFPPNSVSVTPSPILFVKDSVDTQVSLDTVTPANSEGLPVQVLNFPATQPVSGSVSVSNFPATQPISAASLPLPTGAATEAKQDTGNSSLSSIDGKFTTLNAKDFATSSKQDTQITRETTIATNTTNLNNTIVAEGGAQPTHGLVVMGHTGAGVARHIRVDANGILSANIISSALPTGAATEATLSSLNSKVPGSLTVTSTRLLVDGSGVTQPVSGSVSITNLPASQTVDGTVAVSNLPAALGQTTMAASTSVTIASDQGAIPISGTISAVTGALTASYQEVINLTTVAQTVTPPASAKWVKIYADNLNSNNIRVRLAGTATATSGISFEPGRSEDFQVVGTGISVIAEGGTNQVINFTFGA